MSGSTYSSFFSKTSTSTQKFKYFSIIGGVILGYLLFIINQSSSNQTSKAIANFYRFNPHTRGANPYNYKTTLDRLSTYFPYDYSPKRIDKNIIQMWKVPPSDPDFPHRELTSKWKNENPTYKYNLYTDPQIHDILVTHFANTVPEVIEAFDLMPNKIIQSDFSRYLLIFLFGGVYSDIDTRLEKPIDNWFDSDRNVGFVVAIEEDMNVENWEHYMTRRVQFEQWTFKAKARHPILKKMIAKIVETTFNAAKNNKLQAYYKDFKDVDKCSSIDIMEWTGPVVWTDTIYSHLNSLENPTIVDIVSNRQVLGTLYGPDEGDRLITWKFFAGLYAPVMIDDVVIYPRLSFRDDDLNNCGKYCYVYHKFGGSWKNDGKGEVKPGDPDYVPENSQSNADNNKDDKNKNNNNDNNQNNLKKRNYKREILNDFTSSDIKGKSEKSCNFPYTPLI
jgi:mannosyltransferase OCH1-like enzyme